MKRCLKKYGMSSFEDDYLDKKLPKAGAKSGAEEVSVDRPVTLNTDIVKKTLMARPAFARSKNAPPPYSADQSESYPQTDATTGLEGTSPSTEKDVGDLMLFDQKKQDN